MVEDNEINMELVNELLAGNGIPVEIADNRGGTRRPRTRSELPVFLTLLVPFFSRV